MTLVCRPRGRGNWHTVTITIDRPADLFEARKGKTIIFGSWVLRIVKVIA